ncbi:hypothetical protein ABPG74_017175 [Tetrahymena malaccensis]
MCNSIFAVLMCLGYFGRYIARQLVRQDLFLLILKNMYSDSYEKLLNINRFLSSKKFDFFDRNIQCAESLDCNQKETKQIDFFTEDPALDMKSSLQNYIKYDNIQQKPLRDEIKEDFLVIQTQEQSQMQNTIENSVKEQKINEFIFKPENSNSPKQLCNSPLMHFKQKNKQNFKQNSMSQELLTIQSINPLSNKRQNQYLDQQQEQFMQDKKKSQIFESEIKQNQIEQSQIKEHYDQRLKAFRNRQFSTKITKQIFQFKYFMLKS